MCSACQIVLSVARHAADPAVALVDDVDTGSDEGAVVMDVDQDVAVDACIAKSLGVGVPRLRMCECFPSECPAVMLGPPASHAMIVSRSKWTLNKASQTLPV